MANFFGVDTDEVLPLFADRFGEGLGLVGQRLGGTVQAVGDAFNRFLPGFTVRQDRAMPFGNEPVAVSTQPFTARQRPLPGFGTTGGLLMPFDVSGGRTPGFGAGVLPGVFTAGGGYVGRLVAEKPPPPKAGAKGAAGDWTGPATGADNAGLTPDKVEAWIAQTRANSPLRGLGGYLLQRANDLNISLPLALGIMLKESELGTTAGGNFNLGGVTDPSRDQGIGGARAFQGSSNWQQAIDVVMNNLAGDLYRGKSVQDQIGYWFVGPQRYAQLGTSADDGTGGANGTVQDYVNLVVSVYNGLGVQARPGAAGGKGGTLPGGMSGIWGGVQAGVMQDFGTTEYAQANPGVYDYSTGMGMQPGQHTGIDIGIPRGTRLYSPVSGTVITAGGTPYYRDTSGQAGELRIRLDNGEEVILGHMSQIDVRAGQRVEAGAAVGLSGTSDGDHLHFEWRVPDPAQAYGWRIVDPRTKMG